MLILTDAVVINVEYTLIYVNSFYLQTVRSKTLMFYSRLYEHKNSYVDEAYVDVGLKILNDFISYNDLVVMRRRHIMYKR